MANFLDIFFPVWSDLIPDTYDPIPTQVKYCINERQVVQGLYSLSLIDAWAREADALLTQNLLLSFTARELTYQWETSKSTSVE